MIEADDGVAAVDLVRHEQLHIVLIDIMMPRLDGLKATRLIKQEWPETKVVVVTSVPDESYRRAAYASDADAYLDKRDIRALLPIFAGSSQATHREGNPPSCTDSLIPRSALPPLHPRTTSRQHLISSPCERDNEFSIFTDGATIAIQSRTAACGGSPSRLASWMHR